MPPRRLKANEVIFFGCANGGEGLDPDELDDDQREQRASDMTDQFLVPGDNGLVIEGI